MIKKILLSLGLIGFGLINFSYGESYQLNYHVINIGDMVWSLNRRGNPSEYLIGAFPLGDLKTNYNSQIKKLIAVADNTKLFWWTEDGQPYFYRSNITGENGYPQFYSICDKFTSTGNQTINCEKYTYTTADRQSVIEFMSTIDYGDYFGYITTGSPYGLCFSSEIKNYSLCFYYDSTYFPLRDGLYIDDNRFLYSTVPDEYLFDGPGNLYNGGGNSNIPISGGQSPISGGYSFMNCTNQNVLAYYVKTFGYNGDMCNLQSGGVSDGYYPYGTLLEFCNIYYTFYNIDGTFLNQLYTGHNKNIVCNTLGAYFTGDYSVSIDWSDEFPGVINGSGEYEVQSSDSFLINLTNILKGNFYLPEAGDFGLGYLPRYIILGFMGVIFFNFIRK